MDEADYPSLDKTAFSVASIFEPSDEKAYWLARTPDERLRAVEIMRQIIYGYNPATDRLQRFFEVVERTQS